TAAEALAPGTPQTAMGLAQTYATERKWADAERVLEACMKQHPQFTPALEGLANLWAAQQQPGKAIARLEGFTREYPNDAGVRVLLARLLVQQKKYDSAGAELARAIQ